MAKATGTALAIRCETFIDAFEKRVAEAQKNIRRMEASEAEYRACERALRRIALPNDGGLVLDANGATIHITAQPTDHSEIFARLAMEVGRELVEAKLHHDGEPAASQWWNDLQYRFRTKRRDGTLGAVTMTVTVPLAGIRDLQVVQYEETRTDTGYRLEPRETPKPAPFPRGPVHEAPPTAAFDLPL